MVRGGLHTVTIGYEVDLNLKPEERYEATAEYYRDGLKPNLVVWLVRNVWIAERIFWILKRKDYAGDEATLAKRHVFILLEDFKENAWGAKVIGGPLKNESIHKLHANLIQSAGKTNAKLAQKTMTEIFFPKFKSPQKSIASLKTEVLQNSLTPFGLRGETNE